MNSDIRLSTGFFHHPKTVKLKRRMGPAGLVALLQLWTWAAQNKPDGNLSGMDEEDVAIAAGWDEDACLFVQALSAARFLDGQAGAYVLHGWQEHQAYAAAEPARIEKARKAAQARWARRDASGNAPSIPEHASSNAQSMQGYDLAMPQTKPNQTKQEEENNTHIESHDLYAPQQAQCACASSPPLNGEDIAERRDAAQAHHQRGDYEFNTLRSEYDRVKREAPYEGRAEFMRLFHSPEWGSSSLDEILAGLDRLASSDRGFVCEERFRPGLAKFLSTRMWTMQARSPDDEGIPTPEQAEQKRRYEEGRKAYEAKMAARRAARS